jgi:amino-acid N-acetyltransferase
LLLFGADLGLIDENGLWCVVRPQQVPAHLQRLGSNYQAELLDAAAERRGGVARSHIVSYAENGALLMNCSPATVAVRWWRRSR